MVPDNENPETLLCQLTFGKLKSLHIILILHPEDCHNSSTVSACVVYNLIGAAGGIYTPPISNKCFLDIDNLINSCSTDCTAQHNKEGHNVCLTTIKTPLPLVHVLVNTFLSTLNIVNPVKPNFASTIFEES